MIDSLGIEETTEIVRGWVKNLQGRQVYTSDTNVLKPELRSMWNDYRHLLFAKDDSKGEAENLRLLWANQYDRGVHVNISGAGLIITKIKHQQLNFWRASYQNMRKICM